MAITTTDFNQPGPKIALAWSKNPLKQRETVFFSSSNRYDIVVAGGYDRPESEYLDDCEIYNTVTRVWREGPNLPQPLSFMSSVQYEDTFLLVGGQNLDQKFDTIYQYDQTSETWIIREERLSAPKSVMGAVLAGPPAAECG